MKKVYLIAAIVALLAGCATYIFAQNLIENSSVSDAPTSQVLVALVDIPEGTSITAETVDQLFTVKSVLTADLTTNAVANKDEVIGRIATQDIFMGEQLNSMVFVNKDNGDAGLSFTLEEDEVAYSISASAVQGVDGYIKPGDTIDIVAYYAEDEEKKEDAKATLKFEDIYVLKVATYQDTEAAKGEVGDGEVKTYVSLTVKTTEEEAVELYDMEQRAGGSFKFILNARVEAEPEK